MTTKLIAIDLDGTTLNDKGKLSSRTINTLQHLQQIGHHVVIATGRPYRISHQIYRDLDLASPMINFNGALTHKPNDNQWKNTYHRTLEIDFVVDLLEKQEHFDIDWISIEGKHEIYSSNAEIPTGMFFPKGTPFTHITPDSFFNERPTALNLFVQKEKQEAIRDRILEEYGSNSISVRTWGGEMACLEVVCAGIQKALGVEIAANSYGITRQNILAFGDEDNDIEMIDYAGHGVVMKNGIEPLKKIANDITPFTNDQDGLALYLEDYFKLK